MIELADYAIATDTPEDSPERFSLSLNKGEVCAIQTDSPSDACTLLKALATLLYPLSGSYSYRGEVLDFSDYRKLLPFKRKIGYIGTDAAMISNLTVEDNLLLMRHYNENSLDISIDGFTADLIQSFGLEGVLGMRPGEIAPLSQRLAIVVRELAKSPDLLLVEYPEDYIGQANLLVFKQVLARMPLSEIAIAMVSEDESLISEYANTYVSIAKGRLNRR